MTRHMYKTRAASDRRQKETRSFVDRGAAATLLILKILKIPKTTRHNNYNTGLELRSLALGIYWNYCKGITREVMIL